MKELTGFFDQRKFYSKLFITHPAITCSKLTIKLLKKVNFKPNSKLILVFPTLSRLMLAGKATRYENTAEKPKKICREEESQDFVSVEKYTKRDAAQSRI